ncbi:bacillithiol system redox-active protein YtxJ [Salimicrobium sp. PL1-032A]|uniref:bacillithiol system redox-active protein YtxJ n=1 Tax=Salimicrobium sp. PL1-032A TaxID=3095364 RepID=UPI003260DC05
MEPITRNDSLKEMWNNNKAFVLLKHSLTCPISASAKDEVTSFEDSSDIPVYIVPIQEARDVSREVERQLDIKHESPQAFFIKDGNVVWHGTHFDITAKALADATSE